MFFSVRREVQIQLHNLIHSHWGLNFEQVTAATKHRIKNQYVVKFNTKLGHIS